MLTSGNLSSVTHGFGTRQPVEWPQPLAWLQQIHSARVVLAESGGLLGEGDALITNEPDLTLAIRTADCVPILLADSVTGAVAAIHAGWRGTAQRIAASTIAKLREEFGSQPRNLIAAIGPAIGACCYQVGQEVAEQFPGFTTPERKLDLKAANREQILASGVPASNIETSPPCTFCQPDLFHSYRRDRGEGRMTSAICRAKR